MIYGTSKYVFRNYFKINGEYDVGKGHCGDEYEDAKSQPNYSLRISCFSSGLEVLVAQQNIYQHLCVSWSLLYCLI